jgi:outer membrane protein assembly factor BamB
MVSNRRVGGVAFSLTLTVLLSAALNAVDWPRFRGPNGTGVALDERLPSAIDRDKSLRWSIATLPGNSSPVVTGGRVFLTGHAGDQRCVVVHDVATGKERWRRCVPRARAETFHPRNGPTTPSPATDGRSIFIFFPEVGLLAYSLDGEEQWRVPMGPFASVQGLASSPIVVDGRVILLIDTPEEAYLTAFEARTGQRQWRTNRPTGVLGSYATPTTYSPRGGSTQVIVAGAVELTGYDAATGQRLWWAAGVTNLPNGPPFVAGDSVYSGEPSGIGWPPYAEVLEMFDANGDARIALAEAARDYQWAGSLKGIDRNLGNNDGIVTEAEYPKGNDGDAGGLVRTRLGGRGDIRESGVMWRLARGAPTLTGALLYRGTLFVVENAILTSYDPERGTQLQRVRLTDALGEYYASPVAGDGKIYLVSLEGKVTVVQADKQLPILSTGDLGEEVVATPAIADGCVFIRTATRLYAFRAA